MKSARFLIVVTLFVLLWPVATFGDDVAALTGVVKDSTGASVPGVEVRLNDTKTGAVFTTKTSDMGAYLFVKMKPGSGYSLTFTHEGFQTYVISEVSLGVGTTQTQNVQLEVGKISETIEVKAEGEATLNTTDATIGNVVDSRRLKDLPISIRTSPARLLGLQPGVVANSGGGSNRDGSVTGARTDQGNITIDGVDVNDMAGGFAFTTVGQAPIDAIQEFRTTSSNPNVTDGRSSGAQINLITKSGTNDWHGSLRYFHRNTETAANSFSNNKAGTPRPKLLRNQFGGSFGGRIIKDKLFFFSDYEGRRDAREFSNSRTVPLAHVLNGSVAYINSGAGCGFQSTLANAPNCITILTPVQVAAIDPKHAGAAAGLIGVLKSRYPVGQLGLGIGNNVNTGGIRFNSPVSLRDNIFTNRIDYIPNSAHKVFGRFNFQRFFQDRTDGPIQQFPGDAKSTNSTSRNWAFAIGHTWTLNSRMVNQFTFGVTKQVFSFNRPVRPSFPNSFAFSGLSGPFTGLSSQARDVPVPTIRDDFNYIKGNHNFQMGFSLKPIRQKSQLTNDFNFVTVGLGGLTSALCGRPSGSGQCPGGSATSGANLRPNNAIYGTPDILNSTTARSQWDSMFTFLLGRFASVATNFNYSVDGKAFVPGTGKNRNFHYNEYEAYVQDSWRIRSDLTMTYGLRWAYYGVPFEANGFQAQNDIDFENLYNLRVQNAANGVSGVSAEPFLRYDLGGKANNARGYSEPDLNNFAPRFSLAYNPTFKNGLLGRLVGDRKTVFRLGGGVTYDRVAGAITFIQDQVSYLFDNSKTTVFGSSNPNTALLNDPRFTGFTSLPVVNSAPAINRPFTPFVDNTGFPTGNQTGEFNYAIPQNFRTPYSFSVDFSVQRELPGNFLIDVAYVGRFAHKLFAQADASQVLNFKDTKSGQMMLSAFNALQQQLIAGGAITPQPWFENQIGAAALANFGVGCTAFGVPNCTALVAGSFGSLVQIGDTSDTLQALYGNNLLAPNVGLSGQFSTNIYNGNFAASNYNGLLVSLRKRFSRGLQFDLNYTLSHAIDNNSSVTNTVAGGLVCDLTNRRVCRGNADFDVRHIINSNWVYELPVGQGKAIGGNLPGWLDHIIGGWEVSGIYTWRTGFAFSTSTGSFPVGFNFNSPAVLTGSRSLGDGNIHNEGSNLQFFRNATALLGALSNPANGQIGNRNVLHGPHFWNVDLAVLKNFKMPWSEKHRLQFRWESFNAFNHPSFAEPSTNINGTNFGVISSERSSPREMQFALRYDF